MRDLNHFQLRKLDLGSLIALHALVQEGGVSEAARRTGVTQSAMSHTLRKLRELLGDQILVRVSGRWEPTAVSTASADRIGGALAQIQAAIFERQPFDPLKITTDFHISLPDHSEASLGSDLAARLHLAAPGARIRFSSLPADQALAAVRARRLDLAIGVFGQLGEDIGSTILYIEPFLCISRRNDPAPPITLDVWRDRPHVLGSFPDHFRGRADHVLGKARGAQRFVQVSTPNFLAIGFHVRDSDAIALVPARLARRLAGLMGVTVTKPPIDLGTFEERAIWRAEAQREPEMAFLIEQLKAAVATADAAP